MTSFRVPLPENYHFSHPDDRPKWSQRFEHFCQESGLVKEEEESRWYPQLLQVINYSTETASHCEDKFDGHFVVRRMLFSSAQSQSTPTREGETVDSFVTDLYALAKHCAVGTLQDELIRDRIVVGLLDSKLAENSNLAPSLRFQNRCTRPGKAKPGRESKPWWKMTSKNPPRWTLSTLGCRQNQKNSRIKVKIPQHWNVVNTAEKSRHIRQNCPAKEATCHKCSKRRHQGIFYKSSRTVGSVEEEDYAFLGAVGTKAGENIWSAKLSSNNFPVFLQDRYWSGCDDNPWEYL